MVTTLDAASFLNIIFTSTSDYYVKPTAAALLCNSAAAAAAIFSLAEATITSSIT